jgi:hypothetical protein
VAEDYSGRRPVLDRLRPCGRAHGALRARPRRSPFLPGVPVRASAPRDLSERVPGLSPFDYGRFYLEAHWAAAEAAAEATRMYLDCRDCDVSWYAAIEEDQPG